MFDYRLADDMTAPAPGTLLRVPFGHTTTTAICVELANRSSTETALKPIQEVLGDRPALTPELISLLRWAADYYHHPLGEALFAALPAGRKQGRRTRKTKKPETNAAWQAEPAHRANPEQAQALDVIMQENNFQVFLLMGVTGSGKTEVYLQAIEQALARGQQALVLVPEIGLTPQSVSRFERRFEQVAVSHSELTPSAREAARRRCENGEAQVLIGTRSAVFTPFANLGLIVVDEEHDSSYKQISGFAYSARDFAIKRAQHLDIPLVLGSATPSLESLANVHQGRYRLLRLGRRTAGARLPNVKLADIRGERLAKDRAGMGSELLRHMQAHLARGQQVLLFLNRRGFAPVLQCTDCGWKAECRACDWPLTLHQSSESPACMRCHHCGLETRPIQACPDCGGQELLPFGAGTQRVAEFASERFPNVPVIRIDRDAVRGGRIASRLAEIPAGEPAILVGTQMLAKGHHFPDITLVGVLGADWGFVSPDFRAPEHTAQLILQVAGRAGRAELPGEVLIQTLNPDQPSLNLLVDRGYEVFAERLLEERRTAGLPPFGRLALIRADSLREERAKQWLDRLANIAREARAAEVLGPMPAPSPKRANRYRYACVLLAEQRSTLHATLSHLEANLPNRKPSGVRWMIDVDPIESL